MIKPIAVYDGHTRKRLAFLENAFNISYDKTTNLVWTGSFSLPYSDPKTKYCKSFNHVELWDQDGGGGARYIGLFRIMPQEAETLSTDAFIEYRLEHVITTLLDDVMIGYHEIGNLGIYTDRVINYILENQSEPKWELSACEYEHQFLYGWQDENLLSALFSVVQPFAETDYYWDFDTISYPWRLSLKRTVKEPVTDIRYKKNLSGLKRIEDPTNLTTRLFCYGYGQGDNKLGIADLNDGVPYLDSPNIDKYGVITQVWTDERFTIGESLLEVGTQMLRKLENPAISYEIEIQTLSNLADVEIGDVIRMVSNDIDELMVVRTISKDDVTGNNKSGTITLGDATIDISSSIAELAERQRIAETYSQGAESIFTDSFVDNADTAAPAEVVFTIPENVVHVNEIRFSCDLTPFRAYSRAIQGGGGGMTTALTNTTTTPTTSSGGSATPTTSTQPASTPTSNHAGGSYPSSDWAGGDSLTSDWGGEYSRTLGVFNSWPTDTGASRTHNHGLSRGSKFVESVRGNLNSAGVVTSLDVRYVQHDYGRDASWAPSGDHEHLINIPSHRHTVYGKEHRHYVNVPSHSHYVTVPAHNHTVTVPTHTHSVTIPGHKHDVSLPNHTHAIDYGIYKGPRASTMDVYLDDTLIGTYNSGIRDLNLIDYMSKNANGNIMRGRHTIKIIPNGLTRVECTFQIRLFTNMHGGRQY